MDSPHLPDDDRVVHAPRPSRWSRLNHTVRMAAVALGSLAAAFAAVLVFGAGVLVGAELSDSEEGGHHDARESVERHDGEDGDGEQRDDTEEHASEAPETPATPHP